MKLRPLLPLLALAVAGCSQSASTSTKYAYAESPNAATLTAKPYSRVYRAGISAIAIDNLPVQNEVDRRVPADLPVAPGSRLLKVRATGGSGSGDGLLTFVAEPAHHYEVTATRDGLKFTAQVWDATDRSQQPVLLDSVVIDSTPMASVPYPVTDLPTTPLPGAHLPPAMPTTSSVTSRP